MTIFHQIAPRAFSIFLGFMSMLLPLKPINIYATEPSSPPECEEGYEYIESIGRCYKKCNNGWERNPETNRCRKIRVNNGASFGLTTEKSGGKKLFIAGAIIVAIFVVALGYVGFQFRSEILKIICRLRLRLQRLLHHS